MDLISVIVPIFNTRKYIDECICSIIDQTYSNIEVICVDDCSQQNEYEIVKKYMSNDSRVKYIKHQKNLGVGGARNTGICYSNGEYIVFVDSDDIIQRNLIETAYNATNKSSIDVIAFSYETIKENGEHISSEKLENNIFANKNIDIFHAVNPAFWNKLWRRKLFDNIKFPINIFYEDLATYPRVLYSANSLVTIDSILYKYRIRTKSITNSVSYKHLFDSMFVISILYKFLKKNNIYDQFERSFSSRVLRRKVFVGTITHICKNSY